MKWNDEQINQKWIEFQAEQKKREQRIKAEQPQSSVSEMIRAIYTGETAGMFSF